MKSCDFLFRGIDFLARGGFVGLVIEMKKGADDWIGLMNEADNLYELGNFRAARAKYRTALAASQLNGDEANVVHVRLMMIRCHSGLEEVRRRSGMRRFSKS